MLLWFENWVENCNFLSYIHQFSNQSSIKPCLMVGYGQVKKIDYYWEKTALSKLFQS